MLALLGPGLREGRTTTGPLGRLAVAFCAVAPILGAMNFRDGQHYRVWNPSCAVAAWVGRARLG